MHLIPGLPGEARRAGTGSVQRQKVCSQGLVVKHIPPPALPFHHNELAECHSRSGKTWDSGFQRTWSSGGCCFSHGNAGGSGGADGDQVCARWATCLRPTDLESSVPLQRPQQLKSRCPDMWFTCCLDLKSSCPSEPEPARAQVALASCSKRWAGSQGGTQVLAGEEGKGLAPPAHTHRCTGQAQGSLPSPGPARPLQEAGLGVSAGWLGWRLPFAGCSAAATPAHLPHLSGGSAAPWGHASASLECSQKVPLPCVCPVTVSVTPAIDGHRAWAHHPSFHFILPAGWAGIGAHVTVRASATEGRACPGQQLGGGTVALGPVAYTQSPSPALCLQVEPQPSRSRPHLQPGPQKLSVTVHGPGTIGLGLNRFFFFFK